MFKTLRIKHVLNFTVFVVAATLVFSSTTYLIRGTGNDHWRIANIRERQGLDVVCIGGSSLLTYWQAVRAWNDYGYTSMSYATNNMPMEGAKYLIKYGLNYEHPSLWVVEMRSFLLHETEVKEGGLRNSADSMMISSPIRYEYLNDVLKNRPMGEDFNILDFYLDIGFYHDNDWQLRLAAPWMNITNSYFDHQSQNEGWEWRDNWNYLDAPVDYMTDEMDNSHEYEHQVLENLLEYCKTNNQNVLFIQTPFQTDEHYTKMNNSYRQLIESYGYEFLDCNMYYEEMGIDFTRDFTDPHHVNLFGAEKFTNFFSAYLKANYDLPDHRGEEKYSAWNSYYSKFAGELVEHSKVVEDKITAGMTARKVETGQ